MAEGPEAAGEESDNQAAIVRSVTESCGAGSWGMAYGGMPG